MSYKEIKGDLISLALDNQFDVITHGCNCFCTMGSGIAPRMAKAFGCDTFKLEHEAYRGSYNKLGNIGYGNVKNSNGNMILVVNSYTQYHYGRNHRDGVDSPIDYEALILCMRKINHNFPNKTIGLPKIGAGLAGGDWNRIKSIIQKELKDMNVIVVIYDK